MQAINCICNSVSMLPSSFACSSLNTLFSHRKSFHLSDLFSALSLSLSLKTHANNSKRCYIYHDYKMRKNTSTYCTASPYFQSILCDSFSFSVLFYWIRPICCTTTHPFKSTQKRRQRTQNDEPLNFVFGFSG